MFYLGRGCFPLFAFAMAISLNRDRPLDGYLKRLVVFRAPQPAGLRPRGVSRERPEHPVHGLALGARGGALVHGTGVLAAARAPGASLSCSPSSSRTPSTSDLIGIMLPAVLLSAMRGERHAWLWAGITLLALNLDMAELFALGRRADRPHGALVGSPPDRRCPAPVLVPWMSYALCRRVPGDRFLPRYALYWFYPGHLLVFALLAPAPGRAASRAALPLGELPQPQPRARHSGGAPLILELGVPGDAENVVQDSRRQGGHRHEGHTSRSRCGWCSSTPPPTSTRKGVGCTSPTTSTGSTRCCRTPRSAAATRTPERRQEGA